MKNRIINVFLVIVAVMCVACSNNEVKLHGAILNADGYNVVLWNMGVDSTYVVDSARIVDGEFTLRAPKVSEPTFYKAVVNGKQIIFVADSAESVRVKADMLSENWLNSVDFKDSEVNVILKQVIVKGQNLQSVLQKFAETKDSMSDDELNREVAKAQAMINLYRSDVKELVFGNPKSFASYYALYQNILDRPVFDIYDQQDHILFSTVATSLNIAYPKSVRVKNLCDEVLQARVMQKRQQRALKMIEEAKEQKIPEISMKDINGVEHSLMALKGKTVILAFWSSDDRNSRSANKHYAKLYKKYKSKGLEIYSVSVDTSKLLWEQAMQQDDVTWISACDLNGIASLAVRTYNVQQIPANYIINSNGELVGKDLFGYRLDEKIDALMK